MKKILDIVIMILGFVGALVLSIIAIVDSHAVNITSAVMTALLCCSMFIAGYVSWRKDK